jgi:hypothetical protein
MAEYCVGCDNVGGMIAGKLRWNTLESVYGAGREVGSHIFFGLDQNPNFVSRLAVATNGLKIRIWKERVVIVIKNRRQSNKKKMDIRRRCQ